MNREAPTRRSDEQRCETLITRFYRQSINDSQGTGHFCTHGSHAASRMCLASEYRYPDLWSAAQSVRSELRKRGLSRGDVLAMAVPSGPAAVATLLAAWADAIAVSVLPSDVSARTGRMAPAKLRKMLEVLQPTLLIASIDVLESVGQGVCPRISDEQVYQWMAGAPLAEPPLAELYDTAILQFTSGSSGLPKAVVVDHRMLAANCEGIATRIELEREDRMVSWLPLNHDMGLSAITLALWGGIDLVLIPTQAYARQPLVWLDCISRYRGTLSPAPASAYALVARFAPMLARRDLDLSSWRYAWAGAEPVFDRPLRDFQSLLAPYGLRDNVVQPAYGMAETVVATTLNRPGNPYRVIDAAKAEFESAGIVSAAHDADVETLRYVSNGRPIDGIEIRVIDDSGTPLPERNVGQIQARGTSVLGGYFSKDNSVIDADGWYCTGDVGFLSDGEVFVSARIKDLITRGGLNISPHHLELVVERELELRPGSVAVFSVIDARDDRERVFAVVAGRQDGETGALRQRIARAVVEEAGLQIDVIDFVTAVDLPKTTSGKIQRSELRNRYRHWTPPVDRPISSEMETLDA